MGFFGKKRNKDEDFKIQLEREALEKLNTENEYNYTLPYDSFDGMGEIKPIGQHSIHSPSMITAEEILGQEHIADNNDKEKAEEDKISMSSVSSATASDFLYKKMAEARAKSTEASVIKQEQPAAVNEANDTVAPPSSEQKDNTPPSAEKKTSTPATSIDEMIKELHRDAQRYASGEVMEEKIEPDHNQPQTASQNAPDTETPKTPPPISQPQMKSAEQRRASLLARCNAYLQDEEFGTIRETDAEKYKLESVDSILKSLEEKASQRAIKNHSIGFSGTTETTVAATVKTDKNSNTVTSMSVNDILKAVSDMQTDDEKEKSAADITDKAPAVNNEAVKTANTVKRHFTTEPTASSTPKAKTTDNDMGKTRIVDGVSEYIKGAKKEEEHSSTQIFKTVTVKVNNMQPADKELISSSKNLNEDASIADDTYPSDIEDYSSIKDRGRVLAELKKARFKFMRSSVFSFILLILSLLLITPVAAFIKEYGVNIYHLVSLILLVIAAAVNYDIFSSVPNTIKGKLNNDFAFVFSTASVFIYTLVQLVTESDAFTLVPLAILNLFLCSLGKGSRAKQICKNFLFIADETTKQAITILGNKASTKAIVGNSVDGPSLLCLGAKTVNVNDFLKCSFCSDPNAKKIRTLTFTGLICSAVAFIVTAAVTAGNFEVALLVLSAVCCITAAPSIMFLTSLPLKSAANRLSCYGAMLTGYRAADQLDRCNAIATECNSLFPNGTIRLVDMKPLSKNQVYQSIIDAIAITEYIGSPLAGMFRQAMDAPNDKAPKIDTVVYEDKMGISGWVNDRKIFIGNRALMESHGITNIPEIELDKKIMRKGYFPIYLASDNVPCVLFVVRYLADDEITYELRRLCNTGTTVLVKNCDPNISDEMLCDYFGLYKGSISVMSKQGADQYNLITTKKESCSAGAVATNSVCGLFAVLTASIGVKKLVAFISVLYVIFTVLGIVGVAIASVLNLMELLSPLSLIVFQAVATLITCLPALMRRP